MDDDKRALLEAAFPGQEFSDEQVEAMSEFVRVCSEEGYESKPPKGKKGGAEVELVFGAEPSEK